MINALVDKHSILALFNTSLQVQISGNSLTPASWCPQSSIKISDL